MVSQSDLYKDLDDPELLEALAAGWLDEPPNPDMLEVVTDPKPTTPTQDVKSLKRPRSPSVYEDAALSTPDADSDIYHASTFGGYGDYFRRKRAKLQIQNNANVVALGGNEKPQIFKGLALHINGYTQPSIQVLREMIVEYGGVYHAYLDRKQMITHIIATNLTPAKVREFKHMKVVKPEWLVQSVQAGTLLRYQDFLFTPENRVDVSQGRKTGQTQIQSLKSQFVKQSSMGSSPTAISRHRPLDPEPPLYMTDPSTFEEAARIPGYAVHNSNQAAQRLMNSTQWRTAHTSAGDNFIDSFYQNSRLHYLATWKAELKELVAKAQEGAESKFGDGISLQTGLLRSPHKGKMKAADDEDRVIMHCDFDSFFVSVGLIGRPELVGKPLVVCHSQGRDGGIASTSEVASSSYEARKFGIRNGMSLGQARQLCPHIITLPYEFDRYKEMSLKFYTVLMSYGDDLQAVSVDEALIDVSCRVAKMRQEAPVADRDFAKELAETIRAEMRAVTGCEVSIGISHNIQLARLATRRAKPASSFHLLEADVSAFLDPLPLEALHGVGRATRRKAEEKLDVKTIGDLAKRTKKILQDNFGPKTGDTLYNLARGIDNTKLESDKQRKSVSAEINFGIRFEDQAQAEDFIRRLAKEVSNRLVAVDRKGRSMTLKLMKRHPDAPKEAAKFLGHGICETFNKAVPISDPSGGGPTNDPIIIGDQAWRALKSFNFDPTELRGIGIQIQKLEVTSGGASARLLNPGEPAKSLLGFRKVENPTKTEPLEVKPDSTPNAVGQFRQDLIDVDALRLPEVRRVEIDQQEGPSSKPLNPRPKNKAHLSNDWLTMPSPSQVDPSFLEALPPDIRDELEAQFRGQHQASAPPIEITAVQPANRRPTSESPTKNRGVNVKNITKAMHSKTSRAIISPSKISLFKKQSLENVVVSEKELEELDIDPEVFSHLPVKLQWEQLQIYRNNKGLNTRNVKKGHPPLMARRPGHGPFRYRSTSAGPYIPIRLVAKYPESPVLKVDGTKKGEKKLIKELPDVQSLIRKWVLSHKDRGPHQRDSDTILTFLLDCVNVKESESGIEKAVVLMRFWRVWLRKFWPEIEEIEMTLDEIEAMREKVEAMKSVKEGNEMRPPMELDSESVGKLWWGTFWDVKDKLDEVIKVKFGGRLSLK